MELINLIDEQIITKSVIADIVEEAVNAVKEGHIDPMEAAIRLKANEEILKDIRKQLDDLIIDQAEQYAKGERFLQGVEFNVVNGRKAYDFSDDAEWTELKAKIKAREEYLKARPGFDPETGEANPTKIKYGKDYLTIKFPK